MKRKIAAIMAADVVGYSRLIREDEEETLRRLFEYRSIFEKFVAAAHGRVFNTAGDAVLAEVPSAVDALHMAIGIQEAVRIRNLDYASNRQLVFRIGLTVGDVVEHGSDLLGDGVNVAARLQAIAAPGGICLSQSVHDQVSNKVSVRLEDLGPKTVKNIPQPIRVYAVAATGDLVAPVRERAAVVAPKERARIFPTLAGLAAAALVVALGAAFGGRYLQEKPAAVTTAAAPTTPTPPTTTRRQPASPTAPSTPTIAPTSPPVAAAPRVVALAPPAQTPPPPAAAVAPSPSVLPPVASAELRPAPVAPPPSLTPLSLAPPASSASPADAGASADPTLSSLAEPSLEPATIAPPASRLATSSGGPVPPGSIPFPDPTADPLFLAVRAEFLRLGCSPTPEEAVTWAKLRGAPDIRRYAKAASIDLPAAPSTALLDRLRRSPTGCRSADATGDQTGRPRL